MGMRLVELAKQETGVDFPHIMLLRNAKWRADVLGAHGGSMEEWISIKTKDTRWDYWRDRPHFRPAARQSKR